MAQPRWKPSVYHLMGKLFQRGFAPAQCLLESLDRNRKTELVALSNPSLTREWGILGNCGMGGELSY